MPPSTSPSGAFKGLDIPSYDVITNCMHCGLCLPHCPTYALTGLERSSPRGRIRLIKAVADADLPITQGFVDEMNFCLDCQACETACPAGVKYGSLVEAARTQISEQNYETRGAKYLKRLLLRWFFLRPSRLHFLARSLWMYQITGLRRLTQKARLLRVLSRKLDRIQPLAPSISTRFSSNTLPSVLRPTGSARYRVGFLTGCIMDVAYADVNDDTVRLLLAHGCEVVVPKHQVCCGSLQAHNGDMRTARELARENIRIFSREQLDVIVMNSAGCGAFMKEYGHVFGDDPELCDEAQEISRKTKDITEFLVQIGFQIPEARATDGGLAFKGKRVTYHDACHLVHTQKIAAAPRDLIRSVPGIEYVELEEANWCCGSAGIYNIVRYDDSMKLLSRKVAHIKDARPDILVTANPGCLIQIQHGLNQEGMHVELMHTATFLRRACGA